MISDKTTIISDIGINKRIQTIMNNLNKDEIYYQIL